MHFSKYDDDKKFVVQLKLKSRYYSEICGKNMVRSVKREDPCNFRNVGYTVRSAQR
jgi:hypothetical protein